jgi:glucose 1-dehydrogenase
VVGPKACRLSPSAINFARLIKTDSGITTMSKVQFHLEGRVAVITGGAQGIGGSCARRLARDGAAVALWDRADAAGELLAAQLRSEGAKAMYLHCDVSDKAQVDAALAATLAEFSHVDALVNNAGIFKAAEFLDITEADWDAVIAVNLKGAFLVGQAVARAMTSNAGGKGFGAIVNMSSVNGVMAIPTIASYNASKGAINQLTRVMALSLVDRGIRVNAVAPGTIATELARNAVLGSDAARARIMSRTPMRRLGEPEEIADVTAFLLSDAASYVTGEIVVVDGGRMTLNYTMPEV